MLVFMALTSSKKGFTLTLAYYVQLGTYFNVPLKKVQLFYARNF